MPIPYVPILPPSSKFVKYGPLIPETDPMPSAPASFEPCAVRRHLPSRSVQKISTFLTPTLSGGKRYERDDSLKSHRTLFHTHTWPTGDDLF